MDEDPPMSQVIVRFTAVVVEDHSLPEHAADDNRRQWSEQKRPVRGGEHVNYVRLSQYPQARQINELIHDRPQDRYATNSGEPPRKPRMNGHERDSVAFCLE